MLINLYDINLNYVKMVSDEELTRKENKKLFYKSIQLHIYDNNKNLIAPTLLDVEKSETIKDTIIRYFREYVDITDINEKHIQLTNMETMIDEEVGSGMFVYIMNVILNKTQTKKYVEWMVKNA